MASKEHLGPSNTSEPDVSVVKGKQCPRWAQILSFVLSAAAGAAVIFITVYFIVNRPQNANNEAISGSTKTAAAYGSWVSPITSELLLNNLISFKTPLTTDPLNKDTIYWVESRPSEGGRSVVCSMKDGDVNQTTWTPAPFSASSRVHEYGGGSFFVYNNTVYFTNFVDQRLYVQRSPSSTPVALTTDTGSDWRYADGQYIHTHDVIVTIREDHSVVTRNESKEAENTIVIIHPSSGQQTLLVRGADFYSSPRVSPDLKKLCWLQWNHPDMPWDSTQLWMAELNDTFTGLIPGTARLVAGSPITSIMEPKWTPDNTLLYISDKTDWWNLYHMTANGNHVNMYRQNKEIGKPHWQFGTVSYDLNPMEAGMRHLVTLYDGKLEIIDTVKDSKRTVATGYVYHSLVQYGDRENVYVIASDARKASALLKVNLRSDQVEVVRKSTTLLDELDSAYFSNPEEVKYKTRNGETAYAYYYGPQSKDYEDLNGTLPPLLVQVHGGPTSQTRPVLNLWIQYCTSRGFGVLDLNYRGSTGYGRPYRQRLYYNWGITDNEDAAFGALHMADSKRVDRDKLAISGGSAGGYTALSSITFQPHVFSAASSSYGIGDLELLAKETHKFESRYLDKLIGPYPKDKQIYLERSPINHLSKIKTPCLFLQGGKDRVVPPNQAILMFNALKDNNVTTALVYFEDEGHGFRKADNIRLSLDGQYYFYSRVFGFNAPGINVTIAIHNP